MKYRVLMEDSVNGEKFNFAMTYDDVQNHRQISFETQAQNAWTDDKVYAYSASILAATEFPTAFIVSAEYVEPNLHELLQRAKNRLGGNDLGGFAINQ